MVGIEMVLGPAAKMVYPSGFAFFTATKTKPCEAPGLFITTMFCPRILLAPVQIALWTKSLALPACVPERVLQWKHQREVVLPEHVRDAVNLQEPPAEHHDCDIVLLDSLLDVI